MNTADKILISTCLPSSNFMYLPVIELIWHLMELLWLDFFFLTTFRFHCWATAKKGIMQQNKPNKIDFFFRSATIHHFFASINNYYYLALVVTLCIIQVLWFSRVFFFSWALIRISYVIEKAHTHRNNLYTRNIIIHQYGDRSAQRQKCKKKKN